MAEYEEKPPPYSQYEAPGAPVLIPATHHYNVPPPPPPPAYNKNDYIPQQPAPFNPYIPHNSSAQLNRPIPNYGATVTATTVTLAPTTEIIIIGGCPVCKCGILEDEYTFCGILCCLLFFPLGILCCLAMREKKCSNCGATFK